MNRSAFWMIKYMNGSVFSKARYMNGVGFEILARSPVPKLPLLSPREFDRHEALSRHSENKTFLSARPYPCLYSECPPPPPPLPGYIYIGS